MLPGFTVTGRDYGFGLPSVVDGGVIRMTFDNTGKRKHEAVIVAAGDTPIERVKEDLLPVVAGLGDATPAYMHFNGGVSLVPGGTSEMAIMTLPAGRYVAYGTTPDG